MLAKKTIVGLFPDAPEQRGNRGFYVAHQPEIHRSAPSNVFWIFVDLHLRHAGAWQEFGKRKIRAQHQEEIRAIDGAISSPISDQTRHTHCIGIVVFQPLLAAKSVAHRRVQFGGAPPGIHRRQKLPPSRPRQSS